MTDTDSLTFEFAAPVLYTDERLVKHYIPVPEEIASAIVSTGNRRVVISMNGVSFDRSIQGYKQGEPHVLIGKTHLKEAGITRGDNVIVSLQPADPDHVELCEEFVEVLAQDAGARERFDKMTRGRQRSLAIYVNTPKRSETRIKRSLEMAMKLRTRTLYGDRDRG